MNKQKLKERKNKMRNSKGITLVALIITIIVLLILAVVAIAAVNDGGIIQKTQDAKSEHLIGQEKEEILLAHNGWSIQKYQPNNDKEFLAYMQTALARTGAEVTGDNSKVTITMPSTNEYTITDGGEINPVPKGISVTVDKTTLAPEETATLTVSGVGGLQVDTSKITYSSDKPEFATVSTDGTVTAVAAGTAEITVTYDGTYTKKVTIIVQAPAVADNWNYAWICKEETVDGETVSKWQDTVYTSESDLPNDYIIIAKFYEKSDESDIAPVIDGGELPSGKPYRMSIELKDGVTGPKSMGVILEGGRTPCGWAQQVMNFTGPGSTLPLICYTTDVIIGDGINNIGEYAFFYSIVSNIILSNDIKTIDEYAFGDSYGLLTTITLPEGVTKIGAYAFNRCSELTTITIPSSVTEIGEEAFKNTSKLAEINFTGTKAQWNSINTDSNRGTGIVSGVIVHCTDGDITIGS